MRKRRIEYKKRRQDRGRRGVGCGGLWGTPGNSKKLGHFFLPRRGIHICIHRCPTGNAFCMKFSLFPTIPIFLSFLTVIGNFSSETPFIPLPRPKREIFEFAKKEGQEEKGGKERRGGK